MSSKIETPNVNAIEEKNTVFIEKAQAFSISTDADYEKAIEFNRNIKTRISEIQKEFKPPKEAINAAHRNICDLEKKVLKRLQDAYQAVDRLLIDYNIKKRDEARRLAEQEKKIADERAKLAAAEESLKLAMEMEEKGVSVQVASPVIEVPVVIPTIHQAPAAPKVSGFHLRETFKVKIVDLKALVDAVSKGEAPLASVIGNEKFLNNQAEALKEQFKIPGCELEKSVSSVTRKL